MRINKNDIPPVVDVPGATARQQGDFGETSGYGSMAAEYLTLAEGTDFGPLLKGLEGDLCQSPHWGYVIKGEMVATFADGTEETVRGGDMLYWPPGHTAHVTEDIELVLFSPHQEHRHVFDHVNKVIAGG